MKSSVSVFASHRIYAGEGSLQQLQAEVRRVGASRVAVLCGRSVASHPSALGLVREALGDAYVGVFDKVQAHSPSQSVVQAADWLREQGANAIVALGGGSAIVTARAASIVLAEGGHPRELATHRDQSGRLVSPRLLKEKIPIFVLPTTPTTATPKAGSAVHDEQTGDRLALFDPKTRASCIIVEPALLATAPGDLFLSASLNTLAMAISGLESDHDNDLSEALLRHAVEMVATHLPSLRLGPGSLDMRQRLVHASILCGQGTDLAGGGVVTAVSHSLGPESNVANGIVNAILLPHAMRFNAEAVAHRYERIAAPLRSWVPAGQQSAADSAIAAVEALLRTLGTPSKLSSTGVNSERFESLAAHAMNDWSLKNNPRQVKDADIVALLRAAW
ncbi:MAG: iron-containing alcohol dehydrogenase [Comamonadaceae bacterium]|nr:iron-containing alcohol dehydrogenase [Comamonadaceae bacterium]